MPSAERRARLPHAELLRLLSYDPLTGLFTRRVTTGGRYGAEEGTIAGTLRKSRIAISLHSKLYFAHQLAVFYMTGEWPLHQVDHRDVDQTNNRWLNLRVVTDQVNKQNKRQAQSNSKTGLLGASWSKRDKRFVARIKTPDGKYRSLGGFDTAAAAHLAYVDAKRELHEGCTI